jgi:hypothetical protein
MKHVHDRIKIDLTGLTDAEFWVMWHQMTLVQSATLTQTPDQQNEEPHPVDIMKKAFVYEHLRRFPIL